MTEWEWRQIAYRDIATEMADQPCALADLIESAVADAFRWAIEAVAPWPPSLAWLTTIEEKGDIR